MSQLPFYFARTIRVRMRVRTLLYVRVISYRLDKKLVKQDSIKIIKNEVGCRDDTVPKTVDTRRHCEEE